jgi:uncharacterized membrane protein YkvI
MQDFKNILKVASIYVATIIGAGFASGQEIVQFFSMYYKGGFYGIIVAGFMFALIGYIVLGRVYKERIRDYDEFLFPTVGWLMGWIMEIIVTLFLMCLFCVMIAGLGNLVADKTGISFSGSIVLMTLLCMVVILTDIKGIVTLSSFITPVLIAGIIAIGLYIIVYKDTSVFGVTGFFEGITENWFFSALIYVSYNSILSIVVMCGLLPYLKTKKVAKWGGILGGFMLMLIAFIMNLALYLFYPDSVLGELPVLSIIERYSSTVSNIYTLILWLAMFISAVTSGYCFLDRLKSKVSINSKLIAIILCAFVIPVSSFGFSNIIAKLYPLFGYMGLFLIFAIIIQELKIVSLKKRKINR